MGEVYRAKDSRLGRDVAIKVLPAHLSANADVRARFEREAKTVSSLNHPNICTLFDVGREGETDYLVMELVEGETLAQRLTKGPLPLADVLRFGAQVADALDRAHRAGVVHRDLKPGNIMLAKSGAKLMDFGLARASALGGPVSGSGATLAALTQHPTVVSPLTAEGSMVGTFQYMAPEQLEGREADARSDLWGLGCVLYEMATGRRAFDGATQASLISAIMRDAPRPLAELAPMSPPALERLVGALLAKDPDDRIQTAHDVKLQLQWVGGESGARPAVDVATATRRTRGPALAWSVAGAALVLAAVAWLLPLVTGRAPQPGRVRLLMPEPPKARLSGLSQSFAVSPDGRTLVFVAADSTGTGRLWVRPLDGLASKPLAGTENGDMPFWSPDSRAIGFFADGKLKRVGVADGNADVLCSAPDSRGGTWGREGVIVFAPNATGGLYSVPDDGGEVTELVLPDSARGEIALRFPEFLPDGRQFLFVSLPRRSYGFDVHLGRLGSHQRKPVMRAGASPVYAEPGWLITLVSERLVAQRFDASGGKVIGKPVPLGDTPLANGHDGTRAASVSRNGVMVYSSIRRSNTQLGWLDRAGHIEQMLSLPAGVWEDVLVSPDDRRALVTRRVTSNDKELWLVDLAGGQVSRFSPASPNLGGLVWSRDGARVVYGMSPKGPFDLYVQRVDGTPPEVLFESSTLFKNPYGWSPDGRWVTFEQPVAGTGWDVWMVPMDGDHKPVPLIQGTSNEGGGYFSPDGRWLAYYSDESGGYEMYVRPFPGPGPRHSIMASRFGASAFIRGCWWSADGRELLMLNSDGLIRTVAVTPGDTWSAGRARELFRIADNVASICPSSDHRRFLAAIQVEEPSPPAIVVDLNWNRQLAKR